MSPLSVGVRSVASTSPVRRSAARLMEGSSLPVPHLIASDPDGSQAGAYANLTTWLPGRVRLEPLNLDAIDELARIAVIIHGTPVDDDHRPRPYEFWTPHDLEVPSWTSRPELWQRAIDVFNKVRRQPIRDWYTVTFIPETSCGKAIGSPA